MKTKFWAIGDTHLTFGRPRDFSHFGDIWKNHPERIRADWLAKVAADDVVLLLGDLSWSSTVRRAMPDIAWVNNLPGRKVLIRGNHDRWWVNINKVRRQILPTGWHAIQGDTLEIDGVLLCGAQGHVAPQDPYYAPDPPHNRYERELKTLEKAVKLAQHKRQGNQPLIIMTHYPPFTSDAKPTAYTELVESLAPAICLYGHLHREEEWKVAITDQTHNGIYYKLVAADFVQMQLQPITPLLEAHSIC